MNWRRGGRIAFGVIGLGTAVTIVVMTRRGGPPPQPPPPLQTLDKAAMAQGGPGSLDIYEHGKPAMRVTFASKLVYEDGRMRLEKAEIVGLGENKGKIRADVVEATGKLAQGEGSKSYHLKGHLVVETDDGLLVESDEGTYDAEAGNITIPGALTFRRGRLSGRGVGGTYDRNQGTMVLKEQATAHVEPDKDGKGGADASARTMSLARGQHSLLLQDDARIVGQTETMTGRTATVVFTDDESAVKFVELRGGAQVIPTDTSAGERPEMNADDITMSMHPDGLSLQHATLTSRATLKLRDGSLTRSISGSSIDLFTAPDGRTLTQLNARDKVEVTLPATPTTPERSITAALLEAKGDEKKGLTSARFTGKPVFTEVAPAKTKGGQSERRRAEGNTLTLALAGKLDAINQADFDQNVRFESGAAKAYADWARYVVTKNQLFLVPNPKEPRKTSHVDTADMSVEAAEIDLALDSENLNARRNVTTRSIASDEKSTKKTQSLFDDKKEVLGFADTFDYDKATGKATYRGTPKTPASIMQEKTKISANVVVATESTNGLEATGNVDSTLLVEVAGEKGAMVTKAYNVRAASMIYDDAKRTAAYQGTSSALATLKMDDGSMEARSLTFELASDSRALKRLFGKDDVFGELSDGYEILGSDLTYLANENIYILRGKPGLPAKIKSPPEAGAAPGTEGASCKLQMGEGYRLNKTTGDVQREGINGAPLTLRQTPCTVSLRPSK